MVPEAKRSCVVGWLIFTSFVDLTEIGWDRPAAEKVSDLES